MTLGAKKAEVLGRGFSRAIQDSSTPSDSARQDAVRWRESHEICHREGTFSTPNPNVPNFSKCDKYINSLLINNR